MSVTDYLEQQRSASFDAARDNDLDVVIPTDRQVTIDIDQPWPYSTGTTYIYRGHEIGPSKIPQLMFGPVLNNHHTTLMRVMTDYFPIESAEAWRSHGGNTHIVLTLTRELSPEARIALQAILGSDPIRELLCLARVDNDCKDPIALFKPRQQDA